MIKIRQKGSAQKYPFPFINRVRYFEKLSEADVNNDGLALTKNVGVIRCDESDIVD